MFVHISFALGLLEPNGDDGHVTGIVASEMSANRLVELILLVVVLNQVRVAATDGVLRLLKGTRLLVAKHSFIQIKVILSVPLLQLLVEIRVRILIILVA